MPVSSRWWARSGARRNCEKGATKTVQWPWRKRQQLDERRWQEVMVAIEQLRDAVSHQQEWTQQIPRLARMVLKSAQALDTLVEEGRERLRAEQVRADENRELVANTVNQLMGWVDELDGVMGSAGASDPWRPVHEAWLRQLEALLTRWGFTEIPVKHQLFDPTQCDAVGTVEGDGTVPPYTVVAVLQRGYLKQGRLWRKARVVTVHPRELDSESREVNDGR